MVGGHEDHRVVVEAGGAQLVQQPANERVRVLGLQHVPPEDLVDLPLAVAPAAVVEPGVGAAVDRVLAAVGQEATTARAGASSA